jgi:uncharacterized protein DUF998
MRRVSTINRVRAACGLLGPAAFTAAWIVSTRRQSGYSLAHEHISGLAAPDAEDPHVMTAGFVALGLGTVAFAAELDRRLSRGGARPGPGPLLMGASGVATVAAGVFRRDRRSNYPAPGEIDRRQSSRNDIHDLSAVASGGLGLASLLTLAVRFRREPGWEDLTRPAVAAAVASTALAAWFVRDVVRPGNGIVQRAGVTIPLWFMGRVATRMVQRDE